MFVLQWIDILIFLTVTSKRSEPVYMKKIEELISSINIKQESINCEASSFYSYALGILIYQKINTSKIKAADLAGMSKLGEKLFQQVKERQSLQIDTVSGATVSTKTILKSIENTLA